MLKRQKMAIKLGRVYVNILGVRLDSTSFVEVLTAVSVFLAKKKKFTIFTPNPEILIEADRDKNFKKILNSADLNIPDGVGLKIANPSLKIIKGRELFLKLLALARKKNWKVFFLGGKGFKGVTAGPKLDRNAEPVTEIDGKLEKEVVDKINKFKPDILFVGFGAPKQERWIYKWLPKLEVGGAMAVGGTFSYIAGKFPFPPHWMETFGLEWLWRLICEPKRVLRMFNAVVIFPLKVFWYKFH